MRTIGILVVASLVLPGCGGDGGSSPSDAAPPGPDAVAGGPASATFTPPTPGAGGAWGTVPVPSDLYLDASGHLALTHLPVGPNSDPAEEQKLLESLATMDGAGVWSNVYFPIAGDLRPESLAGHVKLVDLDDSLAEVPTDVLWRADLHAIVAAPKWGTILEENHRYAAFVTTDVLASDGTPLARAAAFATAADLSSTPADAAIAAAQASLRPLLEAHPAPGSLAVATVFRTQHVTRGMRAMRDVVAAAPPPVLSMDTAHVFLSDAELDDLFGVAAPGATPGLDETAVRPQPHAHVRAVVHGTLELDNFLAATPGVGGFVDFDAQGVPAVKGKSPARFTLVLPRQASWADLPVIIYVHGLNRTRNHMLVQAETATQRGMALIAIDLPYHGDRARQPKDTRNEITEVLGADGFGDEVGLIPAVDFFHVLASGGIPATHMRAMRDNLRQAAADLCAVAAFVDAGDLTKIRDQLAAAGGLPADLSFRDGSAILTESFGSMISVVTLAVEPRVGAAVLSVAAAGFPYPAVLHSANFSETFSGVVLRPFDLTRVVLGDPVVGARFDPVVNLYNSALEQGDAAGFAHALRSGELRGGSPPDLLMTMMWGDEWVPNEATEGIVGMIGLPRVPLALPGALPGEAIRYATLATASAPLSGNLGGGRTGGLVVYHPGVHGFLRYARGLLWFSRVEPPFVMDDQARVTDTPLVAFHAQWSRFLDDAFAGVAPSIIDPFQ